MDNSDGAIAIAMELSSGQALSKLCDAPIEFGRFRHLAGQIASAVASAHDDNVVHGDLKPSNVHVLPYDIIKVMDFGIAMACRRRTPEGVTISQDDSFDFGESEDRDETTMIQSNQDLDSEPLSSANTQHTLLENDGRAFGLLGTPGYMSPEQSQGISATKKSDTFSLGILFFEMLTATSAFPGKSLVTIIMRVQDESLASELSAQVPAALRELLSQMLAFDPNDRPTMNEVSEQLQQLV